MFILWSGERLRNFVRGGFVDAEIRRHASCWHSPGFAAQARRQAGCEFLELLHVKIDHWSDVERQDLRNDQAADHSDAKGWRASAPAPQPIAMGMAPTIAAMVVIMIGRKRTNAPS